jgi:hypothetical protein
MPKKRVSYDPYYSDGYLLEAASVLASAPTSAPDGRRLHRGVAVGVYTALSAEAHINYAIYKAFDANKERDRLLALELRNKLQYIPQLVAGQAVFDPGRAPLGDLFALVGERNKMVHANPPEWSFSGSDKSMVISFDRAGIALSVAARYLSSLCRYLQELENAAPTVWKDQGWLARELLKHDAALRAWRPKRHRSRLQELVDHLTHYTPEP